MTSSFLAPSGRIVLADDLHAYVADGFSGPAITALSVATGEAIWVRDDLARGDNVFLQAVIGDQLLINGQYHVVRAVVRSTGEDLWSFELPEGYGAVTSAAAGDTLIVASEAPREGDIRPPIVYAIQLGDGRELWHTQLAEGTDLQWHSPPTSGDMVIFQSTLSHQGNASGNMAHAIDVHTGEIGWTVDLGGDQGFHFYPTLVSSDQAFLAGPTSV